MLLRRVEEMCVDDYGLCDLRIICQGAQFYTHRSVLHSQVSFTHTGQFYTQRSVLHAEVSFTRTGQFYILRSVLHAQISFTRRGQFYVYIIINVEKQA